MNDYFEVRLTNGKLLSFNFECNNINCKNPNVCLFTHIDKNTNKYRCLAAIPYGMIETILSYHKD